MENTQGTIAALGSLWVILAAMFAFYLTISPNADITALRKVVLGKKSGKVRNMVKKVYTILAALTLFYILLFGLVFLLAFLELAITIFPNWSLLILAIMALLPPTGIAIYLWIKLPNNETSTENDQNVENRF